MAIIYPLNFPNLKSPKRVRLYSANTVGVARSPYTHKTQVQAFSGQSWLADVTMPEMMREDAEAYNAFLLALQGQEGTFYLGDTLGRQPRGNAGGSPKVKGAGQVGNSIVTDGWAENVTGILLKGDYVQIGTGLHKMLNDADTNGSGEATLDLWPRMAQPTTDNETIVTENCVGIFRLQSNVTPIYEADEQRVYSIGFSCVEAK